MRDLRAFIPPLVCGITLICSLAIGPACAGDRQDRSPAVAGQFYPVDPGELRSMIEELLHRAALPEPRRHPLAIIVPHAGYVFSGGVAACGYAALDTGKTYQAIFVIGPSHHFGFEGAAVYVAGDFLTPLGRVAVNTRVGKELLRKDRVFSDRTDAHAREHSIEVQLPFLQVLMHRPVSIVPIVLGTQRPETCAKIAAALEPYLTPDNLFIFSSDFSHYPGYDDAVRADRTTADAIAGGSPRDFTRAVGEVEGGGTPGLVTAACGWPCILTLLDMTQHHAGMRYDLIRYRNSGDAEGYGNRQSVVGYWAVQAFGGGDPPFELSSGERQQLLSIARATLEACVRGNAEPKVDAAGLPAILRTPCGAFVTLNSHGELRGCIGRFDASEPLVDVVQSMTVAAALQDPRFEPVRPAELAGITVEISVLTPMRRITSIDELELGKHGVYIRKGNRSGTFLPQVATETGWTKEEFLGHCARDKAGLAWDGWKDAELYVYEALVFGDKEH